MCCQVSPPPPLRRGGASLPAREGSGSGASFLQSLKTKGEASLAVRAAAKPYTLTTLIKLIHSSPSSCQPLSGVRSVSFFHHQSACGHAFK